MSELSRDDPKVSTSLLVGVVGTILIAVSILLLEVLYRHTEDDLYLEHTLKLARAVESMYRTNAERATEYPDYLGGFYDPPRSTPAATRSEGLLAVLGTCRLAGVETDWIERLLEDVIRHQMLFQLTPDMLWWVPRPDRAAGGWMGGIVDTSIRIPIAPLTMVPVGGDTYQGQLEFTFYLEDDEGASTPIQQSELPLELPGEAVSSPTPIHITYDVGFKVRPGHHRLALSVSDMLGSTSSSLTWYVTVDDLGNVIVADR